MTSQQCLFDLSIGLGSNKKKDKLNALENLVVALNNCDVLKTLHINSKSKGNDITWDVLCIKTHNAIVSLIDENFDKKKQLCDKHVELFQKIISLIFQKSWHQSSFLVNPNLIASFVLAAFESRIRIKYLGFVYLNVLDKYVMSERRSWSILRGEYWLELKNLCKKHFSDPPQGIQSVFFLKLLNEIVRYGLKNSQISRNFLDLFSFLKDIHKCSKQSGSDFEKILLHLTNTLCLQLAVEFRYKVCEFMEDIFESVMLCHERKNPDKNTLIYHFLMTTINIHNPKGLWEEKIFYAFNIEEWKRQLKKIFFLCSEEIKLIVKSPDKIKKEVDLLNLYVNVSNVITGCSFENVPDNSSDVVFSDPHPAKKCKYSPEMSSEIISTMEENLPKKNFEFLLKNLNSSDYWFWLKFLELLLVKYPLSIKHNYCQLIELLYGFLCEKKDPESKQIIIRCLHSLLDLHNLISKTFTISSIQTLDEFWNNISIELIRSLYTETYPEILILIRALISHSKVQDIEPLIGLYCSGTLRPNFENFKTLCTVCQHCVLPEVLISEKTLKNKQQNYDNVRVQLLNWLFQGEEKFPSSDLAKVLIVLISKKFDEDITTSVPKDNVLVSHININDFCESITQIYLITALKNLKFAENLNAVENSVEVGIESCVKKQLFNILESQFQSLSNFLENETSDFSTGLKVVKDSLWFTELLGYILSHFECSNDSCEDCTFLTHLMKSLMFFSSTKSLNLLKTKFFDLSCFGQLFSSNFHIQVQNKIRGSEFINLDFLQYVFELFVIFTSEDQDPVYSDLNVDLTSISRFSQLFKNPKSIFHFESLNKKDQVVVNIVEMLCQYIVVSGSTQCNNYQKVLAVKILQNLRSLDTCDISYKNFYIQLILRVVHSFTEYDGITILALKDCLELMQKVFNSKPLDFEILITTLQVLKDLTSLVLKLGDSEVHLKYQEIIKELKDLIVIKKDCGTKACCKFIECLVEYTRPYSSGKYQSVNDSSCVLEEIIKFLLHPNHEVRLTAAQHMGLLFICDKHTEKIMILQKKKMFKKLFEVLKYDSSKQLVNEEGCVLEYYQYLLSSISLISWASVISISKYWRKKALFYLIYLAFSKKFKSSDVEDTLKLVCQELGIENQKNYILQNFSYLFYKWTKKGLQIQEFPFSLLGYSSVDELIHNHYSVVISIYTKIGKFDSIKMVSSKLNKSLPTVLKGCHSQLLAFILPVLTENVNSEIYKRVHKLKQFIENTVGSETSIQWLTESLDSLIFNMIRNMHDPTYLLTLCEFFGNLKDDKNPLGYRSELILETLKNLASNKNDNLLGKIALEMPSVVEKILRLLLEDMVTVFTSEKKIFAFYKYIFFVEITAQVTSRGHVYRNVNSFIIRDVVYTLATVLRRTDEECLTDMACECFKKLINYYLENFSCIVGECLPAITTALIPAALKGNKNALEVLNLLICHNYAKLKKYIEFLDVFPPEEFFEKINNQIKKAQTHVKNLKNTVKHFISSRINRNSGCRIEGLKNLYKVLSDKKLELKEMYEDLKSLRGFSEDCQTSLLHQLICMLVELTFDENTAVRTEAAKCLGELGPCDLTTLVLRPENNFALSDSNFPAKYRLIKSAVCVLSDLIFSDNYEVKKASSKALYAVLSTKEGKEVIQSTKEFPENFDHLTPFVSKVDNNLKLNVDSEIFMNKFKQSHLWKPDSHETWIVNLMENLLQSFTGSNDVIDSFIELIRVNWQFAEKIFPMSIDVVLSLNKKKCSEIINNNIVAFFERNFDYRDKTSTLINKASVKCVLNVVDYIRIQRTQEGLCQGFELNTVYLHIARAALYCSAYFTAVFFAELWSESKREENCELYTDVNMICELFPEEGFAMAEILRECHFKIGNMDGIHGCGYMHILNPISEIQHYEHLKNWTLSMLYHDIQLSQKNRNSEMGLVYSLEQFGMSCTVSNLIKTFPETPELTAVQYKCAAKLQDWSLLDSTYKRKNKVTPIYFDKCYYFALKAFHVGDNSTFKNECHRTLKSILNDLSHCSLESSKNLYLILSELQCLKELEEFAEALKGSSVLTLRNLFEKWNKHDTIKCSEFKVVDSVLRNRIIMIKDSWEKAKEKELKDCLQFMLCRTYYKLTVAARKERKFENAVQTLSYFDNICDSPKEIAGKMKVEKARIMWERGDREIGRFLLNHFLKKNEISGELKLKSLRIYGDWMAKTKSENSREIIENYFIKSIPRSSESHDRIHCFASIAALAYNMYEQFNEYLSSPLFEIKQNLISTQQDLASELRQELGWNQNREKRIAYQIAAKQSAIDENEIKNSKAEKDFYLKLAIAYYLRSLKEGEKYNLVVFRIISLWLSNCNSPEVIQELQNVLPQIPTYKFLCLLPQLVPRMADVCLISDLIERILQNHPYHTLPHLFALSNSYEDLKYSETGIIIPNPRVLAASSMINKFSNDTKLEKFISEMRCFCRALIELANYSLPGQREAGLSVRFPEHLDISRISDLSTVPVPSLHIPYNKDCVYNNIIYVSKFEKEYHLVGGINVPKRVTCIGSDGIKRPLLIKGKDDLRQDAVMQQVFTIMNSLLYQNKETLKRKLVIRTYKVVPLSQRSGIIEWCQNTQPLSLYLTGPDGKSGAHKKYFPEDISAYDCRCMIRKVFTQPNVTNDEKLKIFLDICKKLHPVFHHFFIEKFPTAGVWFERRLAYIHSVATSSMIGYILGLGDRHVHNILIDNATAEVIHIDLGIAFEQGKTLPTPETVPFRLTRDIVDGMGSSGVEGDFRISCIKTMEVLRENQDTILTLLEVLLYDPLYAWTITPEKACCIQNHPESSSTTTEKSSLDVTTNKMAERALIRLKQKLQGTEAGFEATTVEGQVRILINEARDPNNLCRLFHGWQAYL